MLLDLVDIRRLAHHHHLVRRNATTRPVTDQFRERGHFNIYIHDPLLMIRPGILYFSKPLPLQIIGDGSFERPHLLGHRPCNSQVYSHIQDRLLLLDDIAAIKAYQGVMGRNTDSTEGRKDGIQGTRRYKYNGNTLSGEMPDHLFRRFADSVIRFQQGTIHIQEYSFVHECSNWARNLIHYHTLMYIFFISSHLPTAQQNSI